MSAPPVLIVLFDRPDVTRRLLGALRSAQPPQLFVAADGPRTGHPTDVERCRETRDVIGEVDWPCTVHTLFHGTNLGLKGAMISGIDWFFEHVESGIILEDDCLPAPDFFRFAGELLDRFALVPQVMHVSGLNMAPEKSFSLHSYFFADVGHVWGWATWRRAWALYDVDLTDWPDMRPEFGRGAPRLRRMLGRKFASAHAGRKAAWSRSWYYTMVRHAGLAIIPAVNLVENIGFDADATHTTSARHPLRQEWSGGMAFPLDHPPHFVTSVSYQRRLARYHARSYRQRGRERARIVIDAIRSAHRRAGS